MSDPNQTTMLVVSERDPGPPRQGRLNHQVDIGAPWNLESGLHLSDMHISQTYTDHKHIRAGYRLEKIPTAVEEAFQYNLYTYYDPVDADVVMLDPRNLNGAEQAVFGQTLEGNSLGDVGSKEQKF